MRALDRKLLRDVARMWGQGLTIALVVACGIASFVTLRSASDSLVRARDRYYDTERFADVFVHLTRAPDSLAPRLDELPGVAVAYARIVAPATVLVADLPSPATARVISLPGAGQPPLDGLHLRAGRLPEPGRRDEAVVLESFARAHRLAPGVTLPVILDGVRRDLRIVGVALSPEYTYAIGGTVLIQDDKRFAVLWQDRAALAPASEMDGAFNDVLVRLQPGADAAAVIAGLDRLLAPYGGLGAYGRKHQPSNMVLDGELAQLANFATVVPAIFLGVAALLFNVVLSRLVHLQRAQIATLKAVGYRNREIAVHYLELVAIIVVVGAAIGVGVGAWLGRGMMLLYAKYFRFPRFDYRLDARVVATGVLVSLAASLGGTMATVRRASRLPPAEAMRPEAPPRYHRPLVERVGLGRALTPMGRMILRELTRRPWRTILSSAGIAFAIGIVVVGRFGDDALEAVVDLQFQQAMREDVEVAFDRALPARAARSIAHLPGVLTVEASRSVPVRLRAGARYRDTALVGMAPGATHRRVVEWPPRPVPPPSGGLMLTRALANILDVGLGDTVQVEVLDGDRRVRRVVVVALADEIFGLTAYMDLASLHRLMGEQDLVTSVTLTLDGPRARDLDERLAKMPRVASVSRRRDQIAHWRAQSGETSGVMTLILTLFGATIAVGIVYNNARVALSMRSRDLASLRVLGFTRAEISTVLLGELGAYVALAVGPGIGMGWVFMRMVLQASQSEIYRFPTVISSATDAFAVTVTLAAAVVSALVVRRQLDRLDLIGVLKTRE